MFFFNFEEDELEKRHYTPTEKIKQFNIYNLFNKYDVKLEFENENSIEIYIGMNGIGKTTILNIFYYTISGNFIKLREFQFGSIELISEKKRVVSIKRDSLLGMKNPDFDPTFFADIRKYMSLHTYRKLHNTLNRNDFLETEEILNQIIEIPKLDSTIKQYITNDFFQATTQIKKLGNIRKLLKQLNLPEILYFPTYRRIEDDASKIGISIEDEIENEKIDYDTKLIRFGMQDVEQKINYFREQVKLRTLKSYQSLTQNLLNYLMIEKKITNHKLKNLKDFELIERIIFRLGKEIKFDVKTLKEKINDKDNLESERYAILFFYLNKLIESYKG